jgi:6-phosphogluconolactonase
VSLRFLRPILAALPFFAGAPPAPAADALLLIGTHASGPGRGFSAAHFDTDTGVLGAPMPVLDAVAPSYFALASDGRRLYACNSVERGAISAYAVEPATGAMKLLNRVSSGGAEPCYISLDRTGRYALVANYDGGSIAVFAIQPDGRVGRRTAFIRHTGHSVDRRRQARAHPHSIIVDPGNAFALSADLGEDRVYVYRFDAATGALAPNNPAFASFPLGFGPRHLKFHPNGKWVYATAEMGGAVVAFNWDPLRGTLAQIQSVSTLPAGFLGINTTADILVHPGGGFLYASNRGPDTLAAFSIDKDSGRLRRIQTVSTQGHMPRNLAFDPTGRWLIAANHDGNNLAVFRVDGSSGLLTLAGPPVPATFPFGIRFLTAH